MHPERIAVRERRLDRELEAIYKRLQEQNPALRFRLHEGSCVTLVGDDGKEALLYSKYLGSEKLVRCYDENGNTIQMPETTTTKGGNKE